MTLRPIRLGINIDHVATLRNARGGSHPDPLRAALIALENGADGITLHVREDRRHMHDADLANIKAAITAPINLEMAATEDMLQLALKTRPHAVCIVPERRAEITTEGGLDAAGMMTTLNPMIAALTDAGIRVSLFIDPDSIQLRAAIAVGAPVVELHTGAYAEGHRGELERLREAATLARALGLECHAGHGLNFDNVADVARIPELAELNIGHFLIGEAVFIGLGPAITEMRARIDQARH
jgi:pyridoxine 5-phosphate synthase